MTEQVTTLVTEPNREELTPREQLGNTYDDFRVTVGDDKNAKELFQHTLDVTKAIVLANDGTYKQGIDAQAAVDQVLTIEKGVNKKVREKLIKAVDAKVIYDASPEEI